MADRSRRPDEMLARRGGPIELLRLPAALYAMVTGVRGGLYDLGLLPSAKLDAPVVSVGNLTAGGTGKTPFVLWLAAELVRRGRRPGVLSRGYRAPKSDGHGAANERENDEARMFARALPDVPRVQNPDRVAGGLELIRQGADVIVLDDGFQHRRLRRDLDLVLLDATRPWGLPAGTPGASSEEGDAVRALLPRGLLRERPSGLRRAHAVVLTRADQVDEAALEALEREVESLAPGVAVLRAVHRPARIVGPDLPGGAALPSTLRGRVVDLVSGLGNPEGFERTVRALGAEVREHRAFPDHHDYAPGDLDGLGGDGRWIVTTAKDAVKLDGPAAAGHGVHVLEVEFGLASGAPVLDALLDALPESNATRRRRAIHEGLHG